MEIKGARILVTGGSKGLGKAIARHLCEKGARVAITARHEEPLKSVAEAIGAIPVVGDVGDEEAIPGFVGEAAEQLGGIDGLVNNAGIGFRAYLGELSFEKFEEVFRINVYGTALVTQAVLPYLKNQGKGHIVNIASTGALKGFPGGSIYGASKAALRSMTQAWQSELRPENIRVIQVNPTEVPTAFNTADGQEKPQEPQKISPDEVAHTVVSALEMDDRGFIPEVTVFATNPF